MTTHTVHATTEALGSEPIGLTHVDPATLLVDRNVRHDTRLDRGFLASVRDLGVLVPIVAVRNAEGQLRVRYGHRRTLAAVAAEHAYVPVVVVADEGTDDGAEVDRLVGQYAENEHRTALSTTERIEVFTQLSAFGVSAAQIAKRTKTPRAQVKAALAVASSKAASAVAERYDFLDLTQAAVIAEFEDDPEAIKALVVAARAGGFEHLAQQLRDERWEAREQQRVSDEITAAGVALIESPSYWERATIADLSELLDDNGERITPEAHACCPGHAAFVASRWAGWGDDSDHEEGVEFVAAYVCTDPSAYGHRSRVRLRAPERSAHMTPDERAAAKAQRRQVIANNKAWRSAEVVRREWLTGFLARKSAPKDAVVFVAESLIRCDRALIDAVGNAHRHSRDLLGATPTVDTATPGRAQMIAVGLVLAAYEHATDTHSWHNVSDATARYLRFLGNHGYELAAIERLACGEYTDTDDGDQ